MTDLQSTNQNSVVWAWSISTTATNKAAAVIRRGSLRTLYVRCKAGTGRCGVTLRVFNVAISMLEPTGCRRQARHTYTTLHLTALYCQQPSDKAVRISFTVAILWRRHTFDSVLVLDSHIHTPSWLASSIILLPAKNLTFKMFALNWTVCIA